MAKAIKLKMGQRKLPKHVAKQLARGRKVPEWTSIDDGKPQWYMGRCFRPTDKWRNSKAGGKRVFLSDLGTGAPTGFMHSKEKE